MSTTSSDWLILLVAVAIIGGAGYWYLSRNEEAAPPPVVESVLTPEKNDVSDEPRYPVSDRAMQSPTELIELPPLTDSDAYFNLALEQVFGDALDALLVESGGVERFVTTVDNLPRSKLSERLRPVAAVGSAMVVEQAGEEQFELSSANFARYEIYIQLFEQADIDTIVASYRRFYPLLQQAYEALGYPNGYFNDRLVQVIDHLLETPDVDEPLLLRRPHVLYEFADPSLEALSSGQKILLRTGPANARRVKQRLTELRSRLTAMRQPS